MSNKNYINIKLHRNVKEKLHEKIQRSSCREFVSSIIRCFVVYPIDFVSRPIILISITSTRVHFDQRDVGTSSRVQRSVHEPNRVLRHSLACGKQVFAKRVWHIAKDPRMLARYLSTYISSSLHFTPVKITLNCSSICSSTFDELHLRTRSWQEKDQRELAFICVNDQVVELNTNWNIYRVGGQSNRVCVICNLSVQEFLWIRNDAFFEIFISRVFYKIYIYIYLNSNLNINLNNIYLILFK